MDIRILPGNIANMIAAGEVVQRPSSVVKELMENAVDAGAGQVTVVLADAGRTLIQVIDNGCGMTPDEAVLCFERHATSKIATAEDLQDITTFGFRGEALASIAAVAEVTLKTRKAGEEVGCKVEFADSRHLSTEEISTPEGSNFAVRNLFYNVPARRKFLKSDNVEFKHVVEEFTRVALTRPETGFTLIHNNKEIYVLKPAKSLKYRIQDLLGNTVSSQVVDVTAETSVVRVTGYVGRPDQARKTLGNQFFFVNGRYFRSPYFHKAVMSAYENMLPQGATPSYFLYLEVDPHSIDVNIHPTKTEIKFEDDTVIFQVIYACLKESLGRNSFGASIDFDRADMPELPAFSSDFSKFRPETERPDISFDPDYNPFDPQPAPDFFMPSGTGSGTSGQPSGVPGQNQGNRGTGIPFCGTGKYVDKRDDYGRLFEDKELSRPPAMAIGRKYVVSSVKDGLLVVNIRRALERILYDRFLKALAGGEHVTQTALFPIQVAVGVDNRLVFDEHAGMLRSLGFDISPFGNDTIVVNGMPEGFNVDQSSVEAAMADVLIILTENHTALPEMMEASLAGKFARMGAAECRPVESPEEARNLVDRILSCSNPEFTASGHRIMTVLSPDEIDKFFN
ncbi:MAG: DNA mismatch repair endonuclease MutL [Candidatus Cryptobacteroides sp.]